jgi:hypothetical protein
MFRRRAAFKPASGPPPQQTLCQSVTTPGLNRILIDWTVWKIFLLAGEPARHVLLLALYTGTLAGALSVEAARKMIALIGILAATQRVPNPALPGRPLDLRRWQIILGEDFPGIFILTLIAHGAGEEFHDLKWVVRNYV